MRLAFLAFYCVSLFSFANPLFSEANGSSKAKAFSLSSEEMVFASKLSDLNRRRFCYQFSVKERNLAMQATDTALSADARVEEIFTTLYSQLEPKAHAR